MDKSINKEQRELLDEAYENYCISYKDGHKFYEDEEVKRSFTQVEFINKCKTDTEFSETWGLKIEERELSLEERWCLLKVSTKGSTIPWDRMAHPPHEWMDNVRTIDSYDKDFNIIKGSDIYTPRKLITITYNDKKIESYE